MYHVRNEKRNRKACLLTFCLCALKVFICNAGFYEFTMHSRANCGGFNESISWHFGHSYDLMTYSRHESTKPKNWWICNINDGWRITWRSAAYHWAEGWAGDEWTVIGSHYYRDAYKRIILLKVTKATDCAIYDGWWDK